MYTWPAINDGKIKAILSHSSSKGTNKNNEDMRFVELAIQHRGVEKGSLQNKSHTLLVQGNQLGKQEVRRIQETFLFK